MYVIFIRKKRLAAIFSLLALLLVMAWLTFRYFTMSTGVLSPIYVGNTRDKAVALMFNVDWGEEVIPALLQILQEHQVRATFFITGRFAKKFPDVVRIIAAQGHEIGSHGYSHPHADTLNREQNIKELEETEKVLANQKIKYSKIFAPPYGEHMEHVLAAADALAYKTIMWSADTVDWKDPPPETVVQRATGKAGNGALILMHPKKCTQLALPTIIAKLKAQNFSFKTVTEIIQ